MNRLCATLGAIVGLGVLALGGCSFSEPSGAPGAAAPQPPDYSAIHRLRDDVRAVEIMDRLRSAGQGGTVAIAHVGVVDPVTESVQQDQTILVRDGSIVWVGPATSAPAHEGATIIDGAGRFASPGLVDAHVHTQGVAEHVLRLAAGVTTVREMVGFPWLLATRKAIASGQMTGATTYVAGTIIADRPLSGYAVVVRNPEDAARVVREHVACGYSFIKVHNNLSRRLFDVVAAEAKSAGVALVGHVPHDISIDHAVHSGGMRTLEHLKGFLIDQTLLPSSENYAQAISGAEVWITPTLYARLDLAHGEDARRLAADPRNRFAPRASREAWLANAPSEGSERALLGDRFIATQADVIARLLPLRPRWLAGTDTAGYAFNIAGFALHDELYLMRSLGIANSDIFRAATSEPAAAMGVPDFGRIAIGARADIVLLGANPLEDVAAYRENSGVMAQGRWFSRASLDAALDAIAALYAEEVLKDIDAEAATTLAASLEAASSRGVAFEAMALEAGADALQAAGFAAQSARVRAIGALTPDGCAVLALQ